MFFHSRSAAFLFYCPNSNPIKTLILSLPFIPSAFAILVLTLGRTFYKSHSVSTHLYLSTEVTSLNLPIEIMIIGSDDINGRTKNSYSAYYMLTFLNPRK